MSGRGVSGRGAILRMLQESNDVTSDEASSNNDTQVGQMGTINTSDSGLGLSRSVGRGRFLLDTTDEGDNSAKVVSSSRSGSSCPSEETSGNGSFFQPKPTSGRGSILQLLKQELSESSKNIFVTTETVEETVESVTEHFEEMKVETEMEPVIRRGTKGWYLFLVKPFQTSMFSIGRKCVLFVTLSRTRSIAFPLKIVGAADVRTLF